jgi:hypothetical protein
MSDVATCPPGFRLLRRRAIQTPINTCVPSVRPSVLNLRLPGDVWVVEGEDETLAVCLGDWDIARIGGLALDVPSFNHLIERCRHRRPRRRG